MFTEQQLKKVVSVMKNYYDKHGLVPRYDIILQKLRESSKTEDDIQYAIETIDALKSQTTENIDDYTHIASEHDVFAHSFDKDMVRRVLAQSTTLPSPYKEVFYMKAVGDVPYTIIAEVFEKTENWARVTYYRARKMVAERVGNNE
jgi:hypothetical protein